MKFHAKERGSAFFLPVVLVFSCSVPVFVGRKMLESFAGRLPGAVISDSGFMAGYYSALINSDTFVFDNSLLENVNWPSGIRNHGILNATAPLASLSGWSLSHLFGPISGQLIFAIMGVAISVFVGALVVRDLTKNRYLSIVAGILFGTSPMMLQWWSANPPYAQNWIYILVIWRSIKYLESSSQKNTLLLAGVCAVGVLWSQYPAVFTLTIASISLMLTVRRHDLGRMFFDGLLILGPSLCVIASYKILSLLDPVQVPVRSTNDASLLYLRLGDIKNHLSAAYLPSSLVALCLIGLLLTGFGFSASIGERKVEGCTRLHALHCLFFFILGLAVFFGPTHVGSVPLPGRLISLVIPQIRSGWYAAQPIQVCLVFGAVILLSQITLKKRSFVQVVVLALLPLLLIIDNYRKPVTEWERWTNESRPVPLAVEKLKALPNGALAHFPWEISNEIVNHTDPTPCMFQMIHNKPLINTCGIVYSSGDSFPFLEQLRNSPPCQQIELLRNRGVRYLLVEAAYGQPVLTSCMENEKGQGKARLVLREDSRSTDLWEIVN